MVLHFLLTAFTFGRKKASCASRAIYLRAASVFEVTDVVVVGVVGLGGVVGFLRVVLRVRGDRGGGDACVLR